MLFQYLSGFEPILYTTHTNEEPSVFAFLSKHSTRENSVCLDELSIALVSKHGMIKTILLEPSSTFDIPSLLKEYQREDMSDYEEFKKQGTAEFEHYINEQAKKIIAWVKSDEIKRYSDEVCYLREKLGLPEIEMLTKFDYLLQSELVGREWLFDKVKDWVKDVNGSQILMLYGKPGAGKSMFSAHLQMRNPNVIAAFPCDCRSEEYSTTTSIIKNIAYRLALRLPDYRRWLIELLEDKHYIPNGDNDFFNRMIIQPLSECNLGGNRSTMVIVIDALDEMKTGELSRFLSNYAEHLRQYVRFLITARKEPEIVERFNFYSNIDIDAEGEKCEEDLRIYYINRLEDILSKYESAVAEAFVKKLIVNSEQMFTYAKCVCDNIVDDSKNAYFNLQDYSFPHGIEELFKNTLDRYFNQDFNSRARYTIADYEDKWQKPLGMILASAIPMPKDTLKKLMNWGDNDLKKFLRPLSTLLIQNGECLQIFHKSFGEWLDSTFTEYATSFQDGIKALGETCYKIYDQNGGQKLDGYIALYMPQYLKESGNEEHYWKVLEDEKYRWYVDDSYKILEENSRFYMALKYGKALVCIYRELVKKYPENEEYKHGLSISFSRVGDVRTARNNYISAEKMYEKSIEILEELIKEYPENAKYKWGLSISFSGVGFIRENRNDYAGTDEMYEKSLEIREELVKEYPENAEYKWGLSVSFDNVGYIRAIRNDYIRAEKMYEKSLEIREELVREYPENAEYKKGIYLSYINIGDIREAQNNHAGADRMYFGSLDISKELSRKYPENVEYKRYLGIALVKVGDALKATSSYFITEVEKMYVESLEIFETLSREYPENAVYKRDLTVSYRKVGDIRESQNDSVRALEMYEQSLEIAKELVRESPENVGYKRDLFISYGDVGVIKEAQSDYEKALEMYEQSLEIAKELVRESPENVGYKRDLGVSYYKVGDIRKAQNDSAGALEMYGKSLEISIELIEEFPKNEQYKNDYCFLLTKILQLKK